MDVKYSIVDKLFFDNWLLSNKDKKGEVFGLFSFESETIEELFEKIKDRDKKKAKTIVSEYKKHKDSKITDVMSIFDNTKCIVKYEKIYTDNYGRATIKVLEVLNHRNEYLEKYLILV